MFKHGFMYAHVQREFSVHKFEHQKVSLGPSTNQMKQRKRTLSLCTLVKI